MFEKMSLPEVREVITQMSDEIKGIFDAHREAASGQVRYDEITAEESDKIRELNQKLAEAQERFEKLSELSGFAEDAEKLSKFMKQPVTMVGQPPVAVEQPKSLGEAFVESDHFKNWQANKGRDFEVDAQLKATIGEDATLVDVDSSYQIQNVRTGVIIDTLYQPNNIGPLIPSVGTSQAAVPYMIETVTATGAAETAEGALAPEADLSWTEASSPVRKISVMLPVTDELLSDVPAIRGIIDSRLRLFMNNREDLQLLKGDGVAPNLAGILNTAGLQNVNYSLTGATAQGFAEAAFSAANAVRKAFQSPSQMVMDIDSFEYVALAKDSQNNYLFPGLVTQAAPRLWGLPVILNENMDDYTTATNVPILVGDFRGAATIFRRASVAVSVSDSHSDNFGRDILVIKMTERLALVIWRPAGFATVTRTA